MQALTELAEVLALIEQNDAMESLFADVPEFTGTAAPLFCWESEGENQ